MLFDAGVEVGTALVQHQAIKAVGFTGSISGGLALYDLATKRHESIPVDAEMGCVNPIFCHRGRWRPMGIRLPRA